MARELPDLVADLAAYGARELPVVQERDVLRPRQADHHAQAAARSLVQQIDARRGVGADRVDAEARHEREVFGDSWEGWELIPVGIGREGAVRDALDEKPVLAEAQKLNVDIDPMTGETTQASVASILSTPKAVLIDVQGALGVTPN